MGDAQVGGDRAALGKAGDLGGASPRAWDALSRWGMAWRVYVALLTATTLGLIILTALSLGSGPVQPRAVFGWMTLLVTPTLGGVLALLLSRRLSGYLPVAQGLAFGVVNVLVLGAGIIGSVWVQRLLGAGDEADWGYAFLVFLAPPVFLACAVAYPFAMWSATPRGAKVCWSICAAAILMFIAMTALLSRGVFDRPQGVEPVPGSPQSKCWRHDADGKTWEIPCNGAEPYEIGVPG